MPKTTSRRIAASRFLTRTIYRDTLPPGPGIFPYLGFQFAREIQQNTLRTLLRIYEEFGPVFTTRFLNQRQVWLIGPEANDYILRRNHKNFSWRDGLMGDLIPFLGNGLLTTDDFAHDRARALIQPLFRKEQVRRYTEQIVHIIQAEIQQLPDTTTLELGDWTRKLALSIATRVLLGMNTDAPSCQQLSQQFERGLHYYGVFYHLQFLRVPGTPWSEMLSARKELEAILLREIQQRRQSPAHQDNILDQLLQARDGNDQLTDLEVLDQVMTLLFAGHDTTTATVSWMFSLLGQHRFAYNTLREEIDEQLQQQPPSYNKLETELPYLERVLAETLRLYPAAWVGPRMARESFEFQGHHIPGGTRVTYSSWLSHRLPHVFEQPEMFDPDRFLPERRKALPNGAYVPFGWGPRLCVGKQFGEIEIKAITTLLLQSYDCELLPGQLFPAHTVPTISPKYGVYLQLRRRA